MNWPDHFDMRVCLTTGGPEWQLAQAEFRSVGLSAAPFLAIESIGPHQSFNLSTYAILKQFSVSKFNTLLFLEDDCSFRDLKHLSYALKQLPDDFDICYLGGNVREDKPERYSSHLYKVQDVWTTHCVAYRKKIVDFVLNNHPGESEQMYDNWLAGHLKDFKAFMVAPMVAYQRPRTSGIWGGFVDYNAVFIESDKKMRV